MQTHCGHSFQPSDHPLSASTSLQPVINNLWQLLSKKSQNHAWIETISVTPYCTFIRPRKWLGMLQEWRARPAVSEIGVKIQDRILWEIGRITPVFVWFCPYFGDLLQAQRVIQLFGKQVNNALYVHLITEDDKITKTWIVPVFSPA